MTFKTIIHSVCAVLLWTTATAIFVGCDVSAKSDLRRAEKLLNQADAVHAERWAEKEYRMAQKYFNDAMDFARERKINEARDAASVSREWAEEAINWALIRSAEMEKEQQRLGTYTR